MWDLRDMAWSRTAGSLASDGVYMKAEWMIDGVNHHLKLSRYDSYRGIYGHESVNELKESDMDEVAGCCRVSHCVTAIWAADRWAALHTIQTQNSLQ